MDSTKRRGRKSKLWMCFRPAVIDEGPAKRKRTDDPAFAVVAGGGGGGKETVVVPKIFNCLSDQDAISRRKGKSHRSSSRVGKPVYAEKPPPTTKQEQNTLKSSNNSSLKPKMMPNSTDELPNPKDFTKTSSRLLSKRSGSFRADPIEFRQDHDQTTTKKGDKRDIYGSKNTGLCLIPLCLISLMLWGRIFAIFCTSIWFVFVPCRTSFSYSELVAEKEVEVLDIESYGYKKRIIMEGLLERNHRTCLQ